MHPRPNLLVVDDDPDILRVVQFYLKKQNFLVHTASNGREAMEMLSKGLEIELVLSDVVMPEMGGLELLQKIRQGHRPSDIPVILISAEGETSRKVAGLNQGADDFITKPFNFEELMARIRNHVSLFRLKQEVVISERQLLQINQELTEQKERLERDLEAARGIQRGMLPDAFPEHSTFKLGALYLPADRLGGDFFDMVMLNDDRSLGLFVADVSGHGVVASLFTAMTKIAFQNASQSVNDPGRVLHLINLELSGLLKDAYVTAFYGIFDTENRSLHYASGGHPPLLVHHRTGDTVTQLNSQATFLGSFENVEFNSEVFQLEAGDRVFFYTDGFFESQDSAGQDYGMERFTASIRSQKDVDIQTAVRQITDDLKKFMSGEPFDDDLTLVGLDVL